MRSWKIRIGPERGGGQEGRGKEEEEETNLDAREYCAEPEKNEVQDSAKQAPSPETKRGES
jgi:hypothetical protein